LERQETSESGPKRRITVACDHNPERQRAGDPCDGIAAALTDAVDVWRENNDPRALRRALLELLQVLNA
jgi:hypothetical protein